MVKALHEIWTIYEYKRHVQSLRNQRGKNETSLCIHTGAYTYTYTTEMSTYVHQKIYTRTFMSVKNWKPIGLSTMKRTGCDIVI